MNLYFYVDFIARYLRNLCHGYILAETYAFREELPMPASRNALNANPVADYGELCFRITGRKRYDDKVKFN